MSMFYSAGLIDAIPDSGISRYTFDDTDTESGSALDAWGSNDGTINGATTGASGANQTYATAEAYDFDGTDDYVGLFNPDTVLGDGNSFSLAFWMQPDAVGYANPDDPVIIGRAGAPRFYISQTRDLLGLGDTVVTMADFGFTADTWTHFIWVYDATAGDFIVYLDGSSHDTKAYSGDGNMPSGTIGAGGEANGTRMFDGALDDIRFYSKAISSTEASNLYTNGSI